MMPLFGLVFAILATVLSWAGVAVWRAARTWLDARALRRRGDGDTVEIVRRPLRRLATYAALVVLAVPAGVYAGGGALPGPSGGGGSGLPLTGGTMTGQLVFSGVSTDISTASGETLTLSPAGTGSGASNVQIVSGDTSNATTDWQDTSFNWSNGTTQGVRLQAGNLDFTTNTFLVWQPGTIRGSTLALSVQTLNNTITLTGLTTLGGPFAHYQGTAAFSGTQNNYTGCTNYSLCRLTGSSTPIITGMTPLSVGEERRLCNYGTVSIVLNHEDGASNAANRFDLPGAANYTLVAKSCVFIVYDNGLSRWLKSA